MFTSRAPSTDPYPPQIPGGNHPVRRPRIQHIRPVSGPVALVPVLRSRHPGVGAARHHRAHTEDTQETLVSIKRGLWLMVVKMASRIGPVTLYLKQ